VKIVREHINEKFKEDSDPIRDMGIGIDKVVEQFKKDLQNKILNKNYHNFNHEFAQSLQ